MAWIYFPRWTTAQSLDEPDHARFRPDHRRFRLRWRGIQADLKTFAAHRVHGLSAIAALTAQNTRGVIAVHVPPVGFLRAQLRPASTTSTSTR